MVQQAPDAKKKKVFCKFLDTIHKELTVQSPKLYKIKMCEYSKKEMYDFVDIKEKITKDESFSKHFIFPSFINTSGKNLKKVKKSGILKQHFELLIQRVIRNKLKTINIWSRSFKSSDQNFIYYVIKAQGESIYKRAEMDHLTKQMELGTIDLNSFEPIDSKNRPYIIKEQQSFIEYEKQRITLDEKTFQTYEENAKEKIEGIKASGGDAKTINRILGNISRCSDFDLFKFIKYRLNEYKQIISKYIQEQLA